MSMERMPDTPNPDDTFASLMAGFGGICRETQEAIYYDMQQQIRDDLELAGVLQIARHALHTAAISSLDSLSYGIRRACHENRGSTTERYSIRISSPYWDGRQFIPDLQLIVVPVAERGGDGSVRPLRRFTTEQAEAVDMQAQRLLGERAAGVLTDLCDDLTLPAGK